MSVRIRHIDRNTILFNKICLGHSLGAGLGILLAFLLRPRYPTLKVYAFSTPGMSPQNNFELNQVKFYYKFILK